MCATRVASHDIVVTLVYNIIASPRLAAVRRLVSLVRSRDEIKARRNTRLVLR